MALHTFDIDRLSPPLLRYTWIVAIPNTWTNLGTRNQKELV